MRATIKDWKMRLRVCWWVLRGNSVMWRMWVHCPGDMEVKNHNRALVAENLFTHTDVDVEHHINGVIV